MKGFTDRDWTCFTPTGRLRYAPAVAICALVMFTLPGCVSVTPASPERGVVLVNPRPIPDDAWPARHPQPIAARLDVAASETISRGAGAFDDFLLRAAGLLTPRGMPPNYWADGNVILLEVEPRRRYLTLVNRLPEPEFSSALLGDRLSVDYRDGLFRWSFQLEEPDTPGRRGLIVHFSSIGDRRFEDRVSSTLRERGWSTLTILPSGFMIRFLRDDVDDADERRLVEIDQIVATLDDYAADYAYSVEAVLDHLGRVMPELEQQPLVLLGFSAGALAVPPVAARLGDRVDAAILIAGGANVAQILLDGRLSNIAARVRRREGPHVAAKLMPIRDGYLEQSRFDPYRTARYLRNMPVLLIEAQFDQIIPRASRRLLYEQLGRPERWNIPLGHATLFWALPGQANRIADWLERSLRERRTPDPP